MDQQRCPPPLPQGGGVQAPQSQPVNQLIDPAGMTGFFPPGLAAGYDPFADNTPNQNVPAPTYQEQQQPPMYDIMGTPPPVQAMPKSTKGSRKSSKDKSKKDYKKKSSTCPPKKT